jgi:methylated-DNA-[protein]-cysteine S-methyltransferase
MAIAWRDDAIERVTFGQSSQRQAELAITRSLGDESGARSHVVRSQSDEVPPFVSELIEELTRFADGEPVDFSHVVLDLEHLTPFALSVVKACRRITWGKTRSYGELAQLCEAPGAARAVGSVMAKNRFPLIVPCHRVLGAGGAIGGYSAPDGLDMKRRLLAAEGTSA